MTCEQARELAALAVSGDVTAEERRTLDSHLAQCAECRAEAALFEGLCGHLAALREESAPEHAYAAVRARVVAEIHGWKRPRWIAAWAALAVVCGQILVVSLRNKPVPHRRIRKVATRATTPESTEPLVVHIFTNDPDVVIYWIADAKGNRSKKEVIQ